MATWTIQGNPDLFDLNAYVQSDREILWTLRQERLAPQTEIGDRVYIWRSKGGRKHQACIVASAVITESYRRQDARKRAGARQGQSKTANQPVKQAIQTVEFKES